MTTDKERHEFMTKGKLGKGTRVKIAAYHLRNTGQFTGDPAPCSHGGFARGEIESFDENFGHDERMAWVKWDDGNTRRILTCNLSPEKMVEPA